MFIEKYPYTDFNEYNLDWVIRKMKDLILEWAKMQTGFIDLEKQFEDLKKYVNDYLNDLNIEDELSEILNNMVLDGTINAILRPYIDDIIPASKDMQLLRFGRFLDRYVLENRSEIMAGQSITVADDRFYCCQDYNNRANQRIAVWDMNGELITYQDGFTELYHCNGMAAYETYLIIAPQSSDSHIAIVDRSTLAFIRNVSLSGLNSIFSVSVYDGKIYIASQMDDHASNHIAISIFDIDHDDYEIVMEFDRPANHIPQNICVHNGFVYFLMNESNMVYRYPLGSSNFDFCYYIPDGDGFFPCGECEDIFVMNDKMYLFTSPYYKTKNLSSELSMSMAQLFETDIISTLIKDQVFSYMPTEDHNILTVDGNAAYEFNPTSNFTTIEEACYISNYFKNAEIHYSNITVGYVKLINGNYALIGISGSRNLNAFETFNATINFNTCDKIENLFIRSSNIELINCGIGEYVNCYQSKIRFIRSGFNYADLMSFYRSDITIKNITSTIPNAITPITGALLGDNTINIETKYKQNIIKLLHGMMPTNGTVYNAFIEIIGNAGQGAFDALTNANINGISNNTAARHLIYDNTLYNEIWYYGPEIKLKQISDSQQVEIDSGWLLKIYSAS